MQINSIYNHNFNNQYNNLNNYQNNIAFEGIKIKDLIPKKFKSAKSERHKTLVEDTYYRFSDIMKMESPELLSLMRKANSSRFNLLKRLVTKYNSRNYSLQGNLREDPKNIIAAYKIVEKPTLAHYNIIEKFDAPIKSFLELFTKAKDKKSLEFVQKMQHDVLDGSSISLKILTDMLASKYKEEFIKKPQNYISYLKLNVDKADAVKELEKLLNSGKYNSKFYDSKFAVENILRHNNIKAAFENDSQFLEQNYSKEGIKFIKTLFFDFLAYRKGLNTEDFADILKMYKSTNSKNIEQRLDLLNHFKYSNSDKSRVSKESEISSMKKLFNKMDNDESSANFVDKILGDNIAAKSISELNEILDIVPSKKAEIFHKNIARIVKYTDEKNRVEALKHQVENPFFMTRRHAELLEDSIRAGFTRRESRFSRITRLIENKINIIKYNKIASAQGAGASSVSAPIPEPAVIHIPVSRPATSVQVQPVKTDIAINSTNVQKEITEPKLELQRTFKESREARKLRVQNDVNEIIKQKLGQKTYERQQETYKNEAMVMRLRLLPEIFDSITDTRKVQRASGLRPKVESKDAVKLYSRINGKNRKLVNYMLKQKNSLGHRLFDVKDILKQLDILDQRAANLKAAKGKEFKAQDAKAIYLNKFDELFEQYGKLKRKSKKKKLA